MYYGSNDENKVPKDNSPTIGVPEVLDIENIKKLTKKQLKEICDKRFSKVSDEHLDTEQKIRSVFFYLINDHLKKDINAMYEELLSILK